MSTPVKSLLFQLPETWPKLTFEAVQNQLQTAPDLVENVVITDPIILGKKVNSVTFRRVSFSKKIIKECTFSKCFFEDCLFIGTTLEGCEFHSCRFLNTNPYKIKIRETYMDPKAWERSFSMDDYSNIGVHLFQQLMENAAKARQPEHALEAELLYRQWKIGQFKFDYKAGKIDRWQYAKIVIVSLFYGKLFGFGIQAKNSMITAAVSLLAILSYNACFWDKLGIRKNDLLVEGAFDTVVYFTTVTLSTLGYGDLVPTTPWGRWSVVIEVVLGLLLTAMLINAIVKRVLR